MNGFHRLRSFGLLNEVADYSDVTSKEKTKIVAYCSSFRCAGAGVKVKKENMTDKSYCLDCHSALFFKEEKIK